MSKKEMIAMLLAGGQGSRLGILTKNDAKPAVSFGGKYRIIDFPLSNCVNSEIDTVGVLTQYQPMRLHAHIGIGIPWDLDVNDGGVSILPPYEKSEDAAWYTGTANAIFQNMQFIDIYNPDYVLILAADHIYKMNYSKMLEFHKARHADVTVAARPVRWEEANRFGIIEAGENLEVLGFEEKPQEPKSNLASMGIYIFSWPVLKQTLIELQNQKNCDFGKHVIPYLLKQQKHLSVFQFNEYWRDVGTIHSYWEANMELVKVVPEFNLYDRFWKIYTNTERTELMYIAPYGHVEESIVGEASVVEGNVYRSVIGTNVKIGANSQVTDSIIMSGAVIGKNVCISRAIIAENCRIEDFVRIGVGEERPNWEFPDIYTGGLATIGEESVIPQGVRIGKNTAVLGVTTAEDYPDGLLESGDNIIKGGAKS